MPLKRSSQKKTKSPRPRRRGPKGEKRHTDSPGILIVGDERIVYEYGEILKSRSLDFIAVITGPREHSEKPPLARSPLPKNLPPSIHLVLEVSNLSKEIKKRNLLELEKAIPASVLILSTSVTVSATEQSAWLEHRNRLLGFAAMPGFCLGQRVEVAPTVFTSAEMLEKATLFFQSIGKEMEFVQDCVGMVMPRLMCQLINEAMFLCQEDVAHPHDIDLAGTVALGSSEGPLALGDKISLRHVAAVLRALQRDLGDPRYRLAPILSQLAVSGEWWKHRTMNLEPTQ